MHLYPIVTIIKSLIFKIYSESVYQNQLRHIYFPFLKILIKQSLTYHSVNNSAIYLIIDALIVELFYTLSSI